MVEIERFDDEASYEVTLRPSSWDEYIGQEKIKRNLKVFIEASKRREEALDHILFFGPKDDTGEYHRIRDAYQHQDHCRSYDRKSGRPCRTSDQY